VVPLGKAVVRAAPRNEIAGPPPVAPMLSSLMNRSVIRAATALLLALALAHAFFAADIAARVWLSRANFEARGDALLLVGLELARAAAILVAAVGVVLGGRGREPYRPMLALAFAAVTVWYGATFTIPAVAGYAQGALAIWLRGAGVPDRVLATVFADGGWALWIAVAAALRGATLLIETTGRTAEEIRGDDSGRPGLLRGSRLAGADVGEAFRRAAAATVERGWLTPAVVWLAAVVLIIAHLAMPAARGVLLFVFVLGAALAFTLLRTAMRRGDGRERGMLRWLAFATGIGALGYMTGGGFALLSPPGMMMPTFVLMAVTPIAVAVCMALAAKA
jgi:hypothetical protein